MRRPLCFVAFVYGDYTKYIPFYIYSILKSYPNYFVKIFVNKRLDPQEEKALELINRRLSTNFEIKEDYFNQFDLERLNIPKEGKKAIRFLIPKHEFVDFENVYFGDIDILIVRENPDLLQTHLEHCNKVNLPYSNLIRKGEKRLTGLHFFKVDEYYEKMDSLINSYLKDEEKLIQTVSKYKWDEEFLYHIVEEGIGFGDLSKHPYRPHHGFHIANIRNGKLKKGYLENGPRNVVHMLPEYSELRGKLEEYFMDPLFLDILELIPDLGIIKLSNIIMENNINPRLRKLQQENKIRILKHTMFRIRRKIGSILN